MNNIQKFNQLHATGDILFLGNAWDLLSALALEKAGFQAIGTTSWGIANTLGYADGEQMDFESNLRVVKRIVDHVKIPVSADIEAGYSENPHTIVENVLKTASLGVAGINLEDSLKSRVGLRELGEHCDLLHKIRTTLDNHGFTGLFINARIDTYLQKQDPLQETISRAKAFVESGASGVFVPGLQNEDEMQAIVATVEAPLNILSLPGVTNSKRLQELGVRRFSFGNAFSDQVMDFIGHTATTLYQTHDTALLYEQNQE